VAITRWLLLSREGEPRADVQTLPFNVAYPLPYDYFVKMHLSLIGGASTFTPGPYSSHKFAIILYYTTSVDMMSKWHTNTA